MILSTTLRNAHISAWKFVKYRRFCCLPPNLPHTPVMRAEILKHFNPEPYQVYLDMTFGSGGHAQAIMDAASKNLNCYFLDRDPTSLEFIERLQLNAASCGHKVTPLIGSFSILPNLLKTCDLRDNCVDFILMDLGMSSMQVDDAKRGFCFKDDGVLDMRMNQAENISTASDVINYLTAKELGDLFKIYGEERYAYRVAKAIVERRHSDGIEFGSSKEFADFVKMFIPNRNGLNKNEKCIHPATRIFQALRIFVNDELNELCIGLEIAHKLLKVNGILAVVSFHSLEDRLVKWAFGATHADLMHFGGLSRYLVSRSQSLNRAHDKQQELLSELTESVNKNKPIWHAVAHVLTPSQSEVDSNPRSRSAKLRVAKKSSL